MKIQGHGQVKVLTGEEIKKVRAKTTIRRSNTKCKQETQQISTNLQLQVYLEIYRE